MTGFRSIAGITQKVKVRAKFRMCVVICFLLGIATLAQAHFKLNLNVRILHVEHLADGLLVYLRTPMPYLVADRMGPLRSNGLPEPAPYTTNALEDNQLVHFLDPEQLRHDPGGLGAFAGQGLQFVAEGGRLAETVELVHLYRVGTQPDFATLEEARVAFTSSPSTPDETEPLYVGDAVVDIVLRYNADGPVYSYALSSTLDPGLPDQDNTANLILDYGPGGTRVFRARGLLAEPVIVSRSAISAVLTFIKEGFRHILSGSDHVLFVLCMVLGAVQLNRLVWRVTGFTLGHSVTLTAGFFGFVPSGAWFIPAVETGIALSIIYAATIAMVSDKGSAGTDRKMFFVTCAIGLLHGLGFSFVLHKILEVTSPDIWQSLLAFNIGIEFGQLVIILFTWPLFRLIQRGSESAWRISRNGLAIASIGIAAVWVGQRLLSIVG